MGIIPRNYPEKEKILSPDVQTTTQIQTPQPSMNRTNNHAHNNNLYKPYSNRQERLDSTAHIKWTSCNFLHSETWENHHDALLFDQ